MLSDLLLYSIIIFAQSVRFRILSEHKCIFLILELLINNKPIKPGSYRGRKNTAPEKSLNTNGEKHA